MTADTIKELRTYISSRLDDTEAALECTTGDEARYLQGFADGLIDADVELLRLLDAARDADRERVIHHQPAVTGARPRRDAVLARVGELLRKRWYRHPTGG